MNRDDYINAVLSRYRSILELLDESAKQTIDIVNSELCVVLCMVMKITYRNQLDPWKLLLSMLLWFMIWILRVMLLVMFVMSTSLVCRNDLLSFFFLFITRNRILINCVQNSYVVLFVDHA